ncbi:putative DOMON domain, cytochrome b561/ferric reductase transmembrane [Dioscorea sansibarensis]
MAPLLLLLLLLSVSSAFVPWNIRENNGGFSNSYNNSALLDDKLVTFFWSLHNTSISIAAHSNRRSGYLALGFGDSMINALVYVAWIDDGDEGRVSRYWIDGKTPSSIHPVFENLTDVKCRSVNGIISFEFSQSLNSSSSPSSFSFNVIDPISPLKVVWAMGSHWSEDQLSWGNMHFLASDRPAEILLLGGAVLTDNFRPILAIHGLLMFVSWGVLIPSGILLKRYLKFLDYHKAYKMHTYLQCLGIVVSLIGVLFAVAELHSFVFSSWHVKFGVIGMVLGLLQLLSVCMRPKRVVNTDTSLKKRILWAYFHVFTGRCAVGAGVIALLSGMNGIGEKYDSEVAERLPWGLVVWFMIVACVVIYLEYLVLKRRRWELNTFGNSWSLGEDDAVDLLQPSEGINKSESHLSVKGEVQLESPSR